jgi:hypothetical protein
VSDKQVPHIEPGNWHGLYWRMFQAGMPSPCRAFKEHLEQYPNISAALLALGEDEPVSAHAARRFLRGRGCPVRWWGPVGVNRYHDTCEVDRFTEDEAAGVVAWARKRLAR